MYFYFYVILFFIGPCVLCTGTSVCVCVCVSNAVCTFMGATATVPRHTSRQLNRILCRVAGARVSAWLGDRMPEGERASAPAATAPPVAYTPSAHHSDAQPAHRRALDLIYVCILYIYMYSRDRAHLRFFLHVAPFYPLPSSSAAWYMYIPVRSNRRTMRIAPSLCSSIRSFSIHATASCCMYCVYVQVYTGTRAMVRTLPHRTHAQPYK